MAEAVFKDLLKKRNLLGHWVIDSAALCDYHIGEVPDDRTTKVLRDHNIMDYVHTVRQVTEEDFMNFDFIFGMDEENIKELKALKRKVKHPKAKVNLLGSYNNESDPIIPDPYYQGLSSFENVYQLCLRSCEKFLESVT